MTDPYQILGVTRTATKQEIQSAFRRLAREYHPDVSSAPGAGERFARVADAYHILNDPETRTLYDRGEYDPKRHSAARRTVPSAEDARSRAEWVAAYKARINRVVDDMIEEERRETRKRSEAVSVVVTLFVSTFMVACARPASLVTLSLFTRALVLGLSATGIGFMIWHLRNIFHNFTYRPNLILSITKLAESPRRPFTRSVAYGFLMGGYVISLLAGNAMGSVVSFFSPDEGTVAFLDVLCGAFVYPPIAVMIVGSLRQISDFLDRLL